MSAKRLSLSSILRRRDALRERHDLPAGKHGWTGGRREERLGFRTFLDSDGDMLAALPETPEAMDLAARAFNGDVVADGVIEQYVKGVPDALAKAAELLKKLGSKLSRAQCGPQENKVDKSDDACRSYARKALAERAKPDCALSDSDIAMTTTGLWAANGSPANKLTRRGVELLIADGEIPADTVWPSRKHRKNWSGDAYDGDTGRRS